MIKRYDFILDTISNCHCDLEEDKTGEYVAYEDHKTSIDHKNKLIEQCRYALVTAPSNTSTSKKLREELIKAIKSELGEEG